MLSCYRPTLIFLTLNFALFATKSASADQLYAYDNSRRLWQIDTTTGSSSPMHVTDEVMNDIAFSPDGTLFGTTGSRLFRINPDTAATSLVGNMNTSFAGSLEFGPDGTLYTIILGTLNTVNTNTGTTSYLGHTGGFVSSGLAFSPDGTLYMLSDNECCNDGSWQDSLVALNTATGHGIIIGNTGFGRFSGMDFVDNTLFGLTSRGELINIDTTTGAGTLVANTNPVVNARGASTLHTTSPLPLQPRQESRLPAATEARNLILITHGWRGILPGSNFNWGVTMKQTIERELIAQLGDAGAADWQVIAYDWTDLNGGSPNDALNQAIYLGTLEGAAIGQRNYQHIHLIGHSAGAGFIDYAARHLKNSSPITSVHTTFLDAYAPGSFSEQYGASSDWSDHYFNRGDSLFLDWTEAILPDAHNVDVTNLDDDPDLDLGHGWPREFYQTSINNPPDEYLNYGFRLSRESNTSNWPPSNQYPVGDSVTLNPAPQPIPETISEIINHLPFDFNTLIPTISPSGQIELNNANLTLTTGSPVWLTADFNVTMPINTLTFTADFVSQPGAEGLFTVYIDNEPIYIIDERWHLSNTSHYIYLGDISLGTHTIGFRLDPFTATPSRLHLTDIATEFYSLTHLSPADLNNDGLVNRTDAAILLTNFGLTENATSEQGDLNGDQAVNLIDLLMLKSQLSPRPASGTVVPEPSTICLLLLATSMLLLAKRTTRKRPASII